MPEAGALLPSRSGPGLLERFGLPTRSLLLAPLASASAAASSWGIAPSAMAIILFCIEEILPPILAQTPIENPSSAGSPNFCSYSTSSPSATSRVAGFNRPPPRGMFTPETFPTRETIPSSGGSVF